MIDSVQVEVSTSVMQAVDAAIHVTFGIIDSVRQPSDTWRSVDVGEKSINSCWLRSNIHVQCTNFNMFFSCENSGNNSSYRSSNFWDGEKLEFCKDWL